MELINMRKSRANTICNGYISYENRVQTLKKADIYSTVLTIRLFDEFYRKIVNAVYDPEEDEKIWDPIYEHEIKLATSPLPRLDVRVEYSNSKRLFRLQCMATSPSPLHIAVDCIDSRSEFRSVCTGGKHYWHTCALIDFQDVTEDKNVMIEFSLQFYPPDTESDLNEDIEHLFNTKKFADAVIVSSDKEEFKVHRNIISARSAVFGAMFTYDMEEARTGHTDSPFEASVLHEVLTFIYSGKSPRLYELASQLLPAATYYQLEILKSMCEVALQYNLNIDNCLDTLRLADEQDIKRLKNLALEFIIQHAKAVVKLTGWPSLPPSLVRELFEYSVHLN